MIIEHLPDGRITHAIWDPVSPDIHAAFEEQGRPYLDFPPVALPDIGAVDPTTGQPIMETVQIPRIDAEGQPVVDELGEQVVDTFEQQIVITGRLESVKCAIESDYILDGQITARPKFDVPAEINLKVGETVKLTGLPDPCNVWVDRDPTILTGGELELEAEMPATYNIVLEKWPYMERYVKVTIDEA
jgi:hypothetical protein